MESTTTVDTYQVLVSTLSELLTVAVHTILAEREVYPRRSFLKVRKWGLAVYQSRHPGVIRWIEDAVGAVEKEILKGNVSQASLVMLSSAAVPLERFVFMTANFPALPASSLLNTAPPTAVAQGNAADSPLEDDNTVSEEEQRQQQQPSGHLIPSVSTADLTVQFRGLLSRLCSVSSRLPALPPDCTFTIAIEPKDKQDGGEPPIGWPRPFIPSDPKVGRPNPPDTHVTPVRNVDVGLFDLETWFEETKEKLDLLSQRELNPDTDKRSPSPEERAFDPLLEAMEGKTFMS